MKHLLLFLLCFYMTSSYAQTKEIAISSSQADSTNTTRETISKPQRVRLNDPILSDIKCEVDCTIRFKLMVDELGNVVSTKVMSNTTTRDQDLIMKVNNAVKTIKYEAAPGEPLTAFYFSLKIKGSME